MAKVMYGGGVADMRGSEAGTTHSRNRGGNYTRNRAHPVNPSTVPQQQQRQRISNLSKNWGQVLTQSQRDAWTNFAAVNPITDVFGAQIFLTGAQAYTRLNSRLLAAGLSGISDAPADQDVGDLETVSLSVDVTPTPTFECTFTPAIAAGDRLQVFATPGIGPGISHIKNLLKLVITGADATASPLDFSAEWLARYGTAPLVGQKIGCQARVIREANGALSSPIRADAMVV